MTPLRRWSPFLVPALAGVCLAQSPVSPGLQGTWTLVRVDNLKADGSRIPLYGEHPAGLLILDASGRYILQILREGRPRFISGDKAKGTAEEYRAAVQGTNAHFGRYEVDAAAGTITFRIDHASFPNWEGTVQVRPFRLEGDELVYSVPSPTSGGIVTGEVAWRRIR
ncbi:MAG TPA: lipocalin-like domain-containing protein [Holophagaceae bacterium]|nr:lipocalin-like domain-containing protein [Holophagaceae bacterium]